MEEDDGVCVGGGWVDEVGLHGLVRVGFEREEG